jgi:hypothetical protein
LEKAEDLTAIKTALAAFEFQELALVLQATAKASKASIAADDAVARNDNRKRILAVGCTYGANSLWVTDSPGKLSIANGFAVRNLLEILPNFLLEIRAIHTQRNFKFPQSAREIFLELALYLCEKSWVFFPIVVRGFVLASAQEPYGIEAAFIGNKAQWTDGSIAESAEVHSHEAPVRTL